MKHVSAIIVLIQLLFAAGCAQPYQVRVTYRSDPPGGTLYTLNGALWGPCPQVLYYDLDEKDIARGYVEAKGLAVRWPAGPEEKSGEVIRITVDGTDRVVTFVQDEGPEERETPKNVTGQSVVSQGTGFLFARSGLVVTNYHVVSERKNIQIFFPEADLEFDATVELKDINNDLVVLKIKDFAYDDNFSQEIPFGVKRSSGVQLGGEVFTLGFPLSQLLGQSAKFSDGTVSSLSGLLGSANLFQINNPIQPGNSGGPLFDRDGNLVGIVLATLDAKFFYENLDTIPQNVNFAIKSDYLINLISMLPEGPSILSHKGYLEGKPKEEQITSLVPYVVTVTVR